MGCEHIYDLRVAQKAPNSLTTAEELLLLAIDPKSGRLRSQPRFRLWAALAGAALVDLVADGSVTLVDDMVQVCATPDNAHYAAALERIRILPTLHGVPWWVEVFGVETEAKAWTIASLTAKGVIAIDKRWWLPPFPRTRYRLIEPAIRCAIANKVLATLHVDTQPDAQSIAITVMADECGLIRHLVPMSGTRAVGKRVRALLQGLPPSPGYPLTGEPRATLIAQVYTAVYRPGFLGGSGN